MVHSINPLVSPSSMRGKEIVVEETNGDVDLNLSLSLNGRFGVNPQRLPSRPNGLITPGRRTIFDENGAELKMWPSPPTRRNEAQPLALMDNKRRSLDSGGSSTTSYLLNQTIEGPIGFVEPVAEKISPKAIPAEKGKGRVFDKVADMPIVFTTISGPMIAGFLAKYTKEEIRILCACHAFPMTPAEFIKHAGGGDVANPFRHIMIKLRVGDGEVINPPN